MAQIQYDEEDRGLAFLSDCIRKGTIPELVSIRPKNNIKEQIYYVEWETIQSLETGILCILGILKSMGTESCEKLDDTVMKSISFSELWRRPSGTIYDVIVKKHAEKGIIITPSEIHAIEQQIQESLDADQTGIIFKASPVLVLLNGLIRLHMDGHVKKMIFVVPESMCRACQVRGPRTMLVPFFNEDNDHPVYVDITPKSFHEYMLQESVTDLNNSVIATVDKNLLEDSRNNIKFQGISFIIPNCTYRGFDSEYVNTTLAGSRITNEYILYKQQVIVTG
jgi:hypothetical protein